ncbi:MAG: hypothetical protein N3D17_07795, partial [bacterium]|nr:hypothetical protein [bacterium]
MIDQHLLKSEVKCLQRLQKEIEKVKDSFINRNFYENPFDIIPQDSEEKFNSICKRIFKKYNEEIEIVKNMLGLENYNYFRRIDVPEITNDWFGVLTEISINCDRIIGLLESHISPVPPNELIKLNALKEEFQKITDDLDETFMKNIEHAIKSCEEGFYLGSVLISSRIIIYILDHFQGMNLSEKIENLRRLKLIDEKRDITSEYFLKSDKKARNYFSHNLNALPD